MEAVDQPDLSSGSPAFDLPAHLLPAGTFPTAGVGPLRFQPAAADLPGLYDLCDDEQAIEAHLDGGDLHGDRASMGVDCETAQGRSRFMYLYIDGSNVLVDGADLGTFDPAVASPAPPATEGSSVETELPGIVLGSVVFGSHSTELFEGEQAPTSVEGLALSPVVVALSGQQVTFATNTGDAFLRDLEVTAAGVKVGALPHTLQPGETAPVVLALDTPDTVALELDASAVAGDPDGARALHLSGQPGPWSGPVEQVRDSGMVETSTLPASGDVNYFETLIETRVPTSHPDVDPPADLTGAAARAALFSSDGRFVEVRDLFVAADFQGTPASGEPGVQSGYVGLTFEDPVFVVWAWDAGEES